MQVACAWPTPSTLRLPPGGGLVHRRLQKPHRRRRAAGRARARGGRLWRLPGLRDARGGEPRIPCDQPAVAAQRGVQFPMDTEISVDGAACDDGGLFEGVGVHERRIAVAVELRGEAADLRRAQINA